jgi:hypothetical protein
MIINELFDQAPQGHYSEKDDQSTASMTDPRKDRAKLTLAHLNQLRLSHDARKLEHEKKLKAVSSQYAPPPEMGAAGGGL